MSAERVFGTETQNLTEDQGLEEQTDAENPKNIRGKRYMTGYNVFMKENSVSFTLILFGILIPGLCGSHLNKEILFVLNKTHNILKQKLACVVYLKFLV